MSSWQPNLRSMEARKIQIYTTSTPAREVTPYWKEKYERDARKYWDIFYKRHQDKFFKDRHYLEKEWGHHFHTEDGRKLAILEVGCGAGNTTFPLLSSYPGIFVNACDFSPRAIALVKGHKDFCEDRINAFVCDLVTDDICEKVLPSSVDIVTMIFMLSAVAPEKMDLVLNNVKKVLKPNGCVLLRDYALGDLAQERLTSKDQMISENFYVRGDGTRAFYFSVEFLTSLFVRTGFYPEEVRVCCKQVENRSLELVMNRRWIQAVFTLNSSVCPPKYKVDLGDKETSSKEIGNGMLDMPPVHNDENGIPEGITDLFLDGPPNNDVIEIKLKNSSFKIEVVSKENQHTCRSTGLILWESAHFMSMILDENPSIITRKVVLELGCGSAGICSMVASQSAQLVVSTDGDLDALELLRLNVACNLDPTSVNKLIIKRLIWGNQSDIHDIKSLLKPKEGFDVIIGTDVSYNPDAIKPLFETARTLMADGVNEQEKPAFILCHIQRRVDEDSIIATASQYDFRLVDRLIHGEKASDGIISSWFSNSLAHQYYHDNTPLNIMFFQI